MLFVFQRSSGASRKPELSFGASPGGGLFAIANTPPGSTRIALSAGTTEVLAFDEDGRVWIHRRQMDGVRDKEAWEAMKEFLRANTSYPKR